MMWVSLGKGVWLWESPKVSGSSPKLVILLLPCSYTAHTHQLLTSMLTAGRLTVNGLLWTWKEGEQSRGGSHAP